MIVFPIYLVYCLIFRDVRELENIWAGMSLVRYGWRWVIIGLPPLTNGDSDLIVDGWEAPGLWLDYVISRGLMVATRFRAWHPWGPPLPTSPHVLVLVWFWF